MARQEYPIGTQDFATLREFGYIYIDKTDLIYNLVTSNRFVFLSRPRRFGKSLLLSTIRYYFEGRKDLFEGLKIMQIEKGWRKYPVLHLELGSIDSNDEKGLWVELDNQFKKWERQYGITDIAGTLSTRFRNIIEAAKGTTGERVVILVDEYDNPLINTMDNPSLHAPHRELLKSIYSNLKGMDAYIKFGMLTGVSRFSNTTIFSGLNNLQDITFDDEYASICGFTREEIKEYLWEGVMNLATKKADTPQEAMQSLKDEYDGYHFSEGMIDIYNPFSLLNCLKKSKIDNYWVRSGVTKYLVQKLEGYQGAFSKIFNSDQTTESLSTADAAFDSPVSLLFQTGYLTIKGYDPETMEYRLGIPNREVDRSLFYFLMGEYSPNKDTSGVKALREMANCLNAGDPEEFLERLQSLLSPVGYHLHGKMTEKDFERTMFVIFHVLGFHVHSELNTSDGRIDLTVETKDYVYVIELKLDKSAEEALEQIKSKSYALPWKFDGRKIFKIGISFSSKTRNITDWIIEEFPHTSEINLIRLD